MTPSLSKQLRVSTIKSERCANIEHVCACVRRVFLPEPHVQDVPIILSSRVAENLQLYLGLFLQVMKKCIITMTLERRKKRMAS